MPISVFGPTSVRGWALASWRGWPLAWLHGTGRTAANKLYKAAGLALPA